MAYDPQKDRRRPRPPAGEAAPIDALLDAVEPAEGAATPPLAGGAGGAAGDHSPTNPADAAGAAQSSARRAGPAHGADPPPPVSVTPGPADPWSDRQLLRAVVASVALTLAGVVAARWYWLRLRRRFHARR